MESVANVDLSIKRTVLLMHAALDDEDWLRFRTFLHPDFRLEGIAPPVQGADRALAVMQDVAQQSPGVRCYHLLHNLVVSIGDDAALVAGIMTVHRCRAGDVHALIDRSGSRVNYALQKAAAIWRVTSFSFTQLWVESLGRGD